MNEWYVDSTKYNLPQVEYMEWNEWNYIKELKAWWRRSVQWGRGACLKENVFLIIFYYFFITVYVIICDYSVLNIETNKIVTYSLLLNGC